MRAVIQLIEGNEESLVIGNIPIPEPGPREILIRVQCSALNRMDLSQASLGKKYPLPAGASQILGVEVSGSISMLGESCEKGFQMNEYVTGLATGGGYAEYCVVDERTVFRAFGGLSMTVLASIPEAFMTAYQLCFFVGNIRTGESVVLHAAASSVGQAAIQMLARKGVKVFATARSQVKCLKCMELGATAAFNISGMETFHDLIIQANNGKLIDAVLDPVGASYLENNLNMLAMDGRLVLYGLMGGGEVTDQKFLNKLMAKRISILPSTLRSRTIEYKEQIVNALHTDPDGIPAIASGEIIVEVDKTFQLEDVLLAHKYMKQNENIGKIVLLITSVASAINEFEKELKDLEERHQLGKIAHSK